MQTVIRALRAKVQPNNNLVAFLSETKSLWFWWTIVLLLVLFIQILTIDVLPHLQQDEVQITDYGRLTLNPLSEWSVTWLIGEGKPLLLWSYLGPLIAEFSFHIGGSSGIGPRIASLVGGIFAASMVLGWLTSRKITGYAAFGLAIAFLLDPLFVLSQRMGRVDAWVIGCCIASCWLLHLAKDRKEKQYMWSVAGAGGLAAVAAFIWPSAIFLYPLIILELFGLSTVKSFASEKKYMGRKILFFTLGGLIISFFLLLPIRNSISIIFNDMNAMVAQNVDTSKNFLDQFLALFNYQNWFKLIKVYVKTLSFVFPVLALAAFLVNKKMGIILSLIASIAIIFASLVYEFRVLYLLPYFVIMISGLFTENSAAQRTFWKKGIRKSILGILILWSIGISLVIRTAMGLENKNELDRNKIYEIASSSVGNGEYKVFLNYTYELYFAGRSLGWKIYTPYIQYSNDSEGNWIKSSAYEEESAFTELLSQMDFAVFSEGSVNENLQKQLANSGLQPVLAPQLINERRLECFNKINRNKEMILWFLRGKETYGSYIIYKRK